MTSDRTAVHDGVSRSPVSSFTMTSLKHVPALSAQSGFRSRQRRSFLWTGAATGILFLLTFDVIECRTAIRDRHQSTQFRWRGQKRSNLDGQDVSTQEPADTARCSPENRRGLARLGSSAGQAEWREMAQCFVARNKRLRAHFVLHISKSGGSSICDMYKANSCSVNPLRSNCWEPVKLAYKPSWIRMNKLHRKDLKWLSPWMFVVNRKAPFLTTSCKDMRSFSERTGQKMQMDEAWLPFGAPCNDFLNVISIREPVLRIISHWNELHRYCTCAQAHHPPLAECEGRARQRMLPPGHEEGCRRFYAQAADQTEAAGEAAPAEGARFNASYLMGAFDLISDNYVARSLSTAHAFAARGWMVQRADASDILANALKALERFDWILLLDSGSAAQHANNDDIVHHGLGLPIGMLHKRKAEANASRIDRVAEDDLSLLRRVNRLDYVLWERARELHALDVASLRYMAGHITAAAARTPSANASKCCGHVC